MLYLQKGLKTVYTISEFSKIGSLSTRALRLYEEKGLLEPSYRGANGYRYYKEELVPKLLKIQQLKSLGFSLEEIKNVISLDHEKFNKNLKDQLVRIKSEIANLHSKEEEIIKLLSVTQKIESGLTVNTTERRIFMDAIKDDVIKGLKTKSISITEKHLDFLDRDNGIYDSNSKREFLEAIKSCVQFAKDNDLILGPGRGSSPASIVLFGLGFSAIDPTKYGLIPERFMKDAPDIHIDVEFEKGQRFVDYCRELSNNLAYGEINAFKMPLLNIINNVHKRIGKVIDYNSISDNDDVVLRPFREGTIDKVFCFDMSPDALIMKFENLKAEYKGVDKISEYLLSQEIHNFVDVLNIAALWRPNSNELIGRIDRYKQAKEKDLEIKFLSPSLREYLKPNFGQVVYHEDVMKILREYTGWDFNKCALFRRDVKLGNDISESLNELKSLAPKEVVDLVVEESKWSFCKPHIIAFAQLIKQTTILRSLHKDIYFEEIDRWEQRYGFKWDDIGVKFKGVSLLQH